MACALCSMRYRKRKKTNQTHRKQDQQPVIRAVCAYAIVKYLATKSTSKSTCRKICSLTLFIAHKRECNASTLELNHFTIPHTFVSNETSERVAE